MSTATQLMTFAEFEQLPYPEAGKMELVNGEVIIVPPPVNNHTVVAKRILLFLFERIGASRVWQDHAGYRVGPGWLEPDVSISWPEQQQDGKYFIGSPMVAIEILSPGENWSAKLDMYTRDGVKQVSIVDYEKQTFLVFAVEQEKIVFHMVTESWNSAAGVTITLADIFGGKQP